jgi:hypothetical protein
MESHYFRGLAAGAMLGFALALLLACIATGNTVGVAWFSAGLASALITAWVSAPVAFRKLRKSLPRGWPFK